MAELRGTICDGCGKEAPESEPRNWIRTEMWIIAGGGQSPQKTQLDYCSNACGVRYWNKRLDDEGQ